MANVAGIPFLTASQAARRWGISERRVRQLAGAGRIPGAQRIGWAWMIPADVTITPGSRGPQSPRTQGDD